MANTKSAIKRMRQNERRRLRNRTIRSQVRTAVKSARATGGGELGTAIAIASGVCGIGIFWLISRRP